MSQLPTTLVAAFKATLEEVKAADVLVEVVDGSNPVWFKHCDAVEKVLDELGCGDKPRVKVFNKIDLLNEEQRENLMIEAAMQPFTVAISAKTGEGLSDFVQGANPRQLKQCTI